MRSNRFSFLHTFEVEVSEGVFQEFTYTIYANFFPPERGHRDSFGAPEEPDTDGYVEIEEIYREDGFLMPEGSFEEEQLLELEDAANDYYDGQEPAFDGVDDWYHDHYS